VALFGPRDAFLRGETPTGRPGRAWENQLTLFVINNISRKTGKLCVFNNIYRSLVSAFFGPLFSYTSQEIPSFWDSFFRTFLTPTNSFVFNRSFLGKMGSDRHN
jgi:hypothetical protein